LEGVLSSVSSIRQVLGRAVISQTPRTFVTSKHTHTHTHTITITITRTQSHTVLQADLPQEASPQPQPCEVTLSPDLAHLSISYLSGAVSLFRVHLPNPPHQSASADVLSAMSLVAWGQTRLTLLMHMPAAYVNSELRSLLSSCGCCICRLGIMKCFFFEFNLFQTNICVVHVQ
jgi:hypothetical protein